MNAPCRMLLLLVVGLVVLSSPPVAGQSKVPEKLNVQGVLRNVAGEVVTGAYTIEFSLYTAETGGSLVYGPVTQTLPVTHGIFNTYLSTPPGVFANNPSLWLEMKVGLDTLPRRPIGSSAFAFQAQNAEAATVAAGLSCAQCVTADQILSVDGGTLLAGTLPPEALDGSACGPGEAFVWDGTNWACGSVSGTSYWTDTGTSLYANGWDQFTITYDGRVGVGTNDPGATLDVQGDLFVRDGITTSGGLTVTESLTVGGTALFGAGIDVALDANIGGNLIVGGSADVKTDLTVGGNTSVLGAIKAGGVVQVGNDDTQCDSATAGTLRWDGSHIQVCNGDDWRQLDNQAPPGIQTVVPQVGPVTGGTAITITGSGFVFGTSVLIDDVPAQNVVVVSTSIITAVTPPGNSPGAKEVKLKNPDEQEMSAPGAFAYQPVLTQVTPGTGPIVGGTPITITGVGFQAGTQATLDGIPLPDLVVQSYTQLTATTPEVQTTGKKTLAVTVNGQTKTLDNAFDYLPIVQSVTPNWSCVAGGVQVTISGAGFLASPTVTVGGVSATSITFVNSNTLTAKVPVNQTVGAKDVVVKNTDGRQWTLTGGFRYTPCITSISPAQDLVAGGTAVTITGTGFSTTQANNVVTIGGVQAPYNGNPTTTSIPIKSPAMATTGLKDVVVTVGGQSFTLVNGFKYIPSIASGGVSPNKGTVLGGTAVTVTGTGFQDGATVEIDGIPCTNVVRESATKLTAVTSPGVTAGRKNVVVYNTDGQKSAALAQGFSYIPFISGVSPTSGFVSGTTGVKIYGAGFSTTPSSNGVTFGGTAATVTAATNTELTVNAPAISTTGAKDVKVTVDTIADTLTAGFAYTPSITSVSPNTGSHTGGTSIVIKGSGFESGVKVYIDNMVASSTLNSSIQITATTPASTSGTGWKEVRVTNTNGQLYSLINGFGYRPVLTSISPNYGPIQGDTPVTLTGSGFQSGATVWIDGVEAEEIVVVSSTSITAKTPGGTLAGAKALDVANADGIKATLSSAFSYDPRIDSVTPNFSYYAGNDTIVISGAGFSTTPASNTVTIDGTTVTPTASTSTTITTKSPTNKVAGAKDVKVTVNGRSFTLVGGFAYKPKIDSIVPNSATVDGGISVAINGSNFLASPTGNSVTIDGIPVTILSTPAPTTTKLTGKVPANPNTGMKTVVVTTNGQSFTLENGFSYSPVGASVTPASGPIAGGTLIEIGGSGFKPAVTVSIDTVPCTPVEYVSSTLIRCTTGQGITAGSKGVSIDNHDGNAFTLPNSFTYLPRLDAVSPNKGFIAGGLSVTLTGGGFVASPNHTQNQVLFGTSAGTVTSATSGPNGEIVVKTPAGTVGFRDVKVTVNSQSVTLTNGFAYTPSVTAISPASGFAEGNQTVTISGTGFSTTPSANTVKFGEYMGTVTAATSTSLTAKTPGFGTDTGKKDVSVTTNGQTGVLVNGFSVTPKITGISPNSGPIGGGTPITLTGSGFGASPTVKIDGIPCTNVTVVSPTQITATTGTGLSAGAKNVSVANADGETYTAASLFSYLPRIDSVEPNIGPYAGGTNVVIHGAGFSTTVSQNTVTFGGVAGTVQSSPAPTNTALTVKLPMNQAPGAKDVVVTVNSKSATLSPGYTYTPYISAINPNKGLTAGGETLTITGQGFIASVGGNTVTIDGNICTVTAATTTTITCKAPANPVTGKKDVKVTTNGQSYTFPNGYAYTPSAKSVTPAQGPVTGGTNITITGTGFIDPVSVTIDNVPCADVSVLSPTQVSCTTGAGTTAGAKSVVVANADGQTFTLANGFNYLPTVDQISPNWGYIAGSLPITITGAGYVSGATTVTIGGSTCSITSVNATTIACKTPAMSTVGARDVVVTVNSKSVTLAGGFAYKPSITLVNPNKGYVAGNEAVTISGTGFFASPTGNVVTIDGKPATISGTPTTTSITIKTPAATSTGAKDVAVTTNGQTTVLTGGYTYTPSVTSVTLNYGPVTGGQDIVVAGTGFQTGATVTIDGIACTDVTVVSPLQITAKTGVGVTAGAKTVAVANTDGKAGTLANGFSYLPVITSVVDNWGPIAGGKSIVINGAGFQSGATSVTIGGAAATSVTVTGNNKIDCKTPAGSTGARDVVVTVNSKSVTQTNGFHYKPTITSVSPNTGFVAGGEILTITGTGFLASTTGNSVKIDGIAAAVQGTPTTTQIKVKAPPNAATGKKAVEVTTNGETTVLENGYTYTPSVTAISPTSGPIAGGTLVTITGTGFLPGATVKIDGFPATDVAVNGSGTQITAYTAPGLTAGRKTVVVANTDGNGYTFSNFAYIPRIDKVTPNFGVYAGGNTVTIEGAGFVASPNHTQNTVTFGSASGTVQSATNTSLTVKTPTNQAAGKKNVTITVDTISYLLTDGYAYTPQITSLNTTSGYVAGGLSVTITGQGFLSGTTNNTVKFGEYTATVTSASTTSIVVNTPAVPTTGKRKVTVTTNGQTSPEYDGFTYTPSVTSVSPTSGIKAGGTPITVKGTGFASGSTVKVDGVPATDVNLVDATTLTARTPPGASTGAKAVLVTNPDGTSKSLDASFTYTHYITSITPKYGLVAGNTTVTITGDGFAASPSIKFGANTVTGTYVNATTVTAKTPASTIGNGLVDVTMTLAGQTNTLVRGFGYTNNGTGQALAGLSCDAILGITPTASSGTYWLDPDGTGVDLPFQAYCDMTSDGGGWTLVAKSNATTHAVMRSAAAGGLTSGWGPVLACDGTGDQKLSDATMKLMWTSQVRMTFQNTSRKAFSFTSLLSLPSFSDRCGTSNALDWSYNNVPFLAWWGTTNPYDCGWAAYWTDVGTEGPFVLMTWDGYKTYENVDCAGHDCGCGWGWVK